MLQQKGHSAYRLPFGGPLQFLVALVLLTFGATALSQSITVLDSEEP